jgi:hypothetical protein
MELFSYFFVHPNETLFSKLKIWILANRSSFSLAVYLSIILHSAIFAIFCFSALSSPTVSTSKHSNQRAIFQAIKEDTSLNDSQGKGMTDLLKGFDISGYNLSEDEKKQVYKKLIASYTQIKDSEKKNEVPREITRKDLLNFLNQKGGFGLKSGKKIIPSISAKGKKTTKLNVLPKPIIKDLQSLQKFPSKDLEYYVSRGNVWVSSPTGIKVVPSQYFFRDSPYEQILAQGIHLFYIVDGFPVLEEKPPSGIHYVDTASENLFQEEASRGFQVILLSGLSDSSGQMFSEIQEGREELDISPTFIEHFDKFCDDFLVLPEEQQFLYFRTKYLERYDLDSGELAYLTRRFIHRNLNNIIIPVSEISSAFDYLEELYFNKPLEHQFLKFWRDYPDTHIGAQLLLTLASHYDLERRTIANLRKAYDNAKGYLRQKYKVSELFNKKTKCYVIQKMFERLDRGIRERGYISVEEVEQKYVEEQIKIYDIVIDMGGEPRNHGLYDLGCLYWDLNLRDLAIDTWAQIDDSYESDSLDSIREALTWIDDTKNAHTLIDNILNWYATKGVDKRLKRLLDLGKWKARGNAIR